MTKKRPAKVRWVGKTSFTGESSPGIRPDLTGWGLHPLTEEQKQKLSDPKETEKYFRNLKISRDKQRKNKAPNT